MGTVKVAVRKGGRVIATIERPLREAECGPAVVYRRKLWRLSGGHIDIDGPSLDEPTQAATTLAVEPRRPVVEAPDDSETRSEIVNAPALARQLVEAGPGTGKTELASRRLAELMRAELSPGQILVLSFSRSAVRTLTRRLSRIDETDPRIVEDLRHLSIRTFDSWAFRMLRLMGEAPRKLLARGHDANIAALTELADGPRREELRVFIGDRRHLIVDEFQDLPGVRGDLVLALLALLAPPQALGCGFTILGDPAQAIYAFARGERADGQPYPSPQEYWHEVCAKYGDGLMQRTLSRNYRARSDLARLSADLRGVLLGDRPEEEKLQRMMAAVAALPAPAEPLGRGFLNAGSGASRAILTNTNGEALRVLQRLFDRDNNGTATPVRLRAGSFASLPPAWIGALLRKLRSPSLPRSQFERIHSHLTGIWKAQTAERLGLPPTRVAWARLARASGAAEDASAIDVAELRARLAWPDAFPDDQPLTEEGLIISTVHQSKGMEFDVVTILQGAAADATDSEEENGRGALAERASVAYVAITRAGGSLERMPHDQIYTPPKYWDVADGRRRLCCWKNGWINMEIGVKGDVDPLGFADPALHGGSEGVEDLQSFLLAEAGRLEGAKVMLRKQNVDSRAEWHIHLQEGNKPGRLIGRTSNQLSLDLLAVLYRRGYKLPNTIFNLRISHVGTVTSDDSSRLGEPERTSGLWLGVGLFGIGDFKPLKEDER